VDQLGATDACRSSPFRVDVKPMHGSPDSVGDVAFEKIGNRVKGGLASDLICWDFMIWGLGDGCTWRELE
jgi:hypothetical protein